MLIKCLIHNYFKGKNQPFCSICKFSKTYTFFLTFIPFIFMWGFFSLRLLKTAQVIKRGNSSHHNLPWNTRTMCQIVRIFDASFGFATSSSNFIVSGSSPTTSGISIVFLATAIYRGEAKCITIGVIFDPAY